MVSFNTQLINQVNFRLPRLENEREANHFDAAPRLELLDGDATPIPVKLDILAITSTAKTIDYEVEVERYNKSAKRASLPQFATMMADDSTLLSGVSELTHKREILSCSGRKNNHLPEIFVPVRRLFQSFSCSDKYLQ